MKRERRAAKEAIEKMPHKNNQALTTVSDKLTALFARYTADDVIVSLNISDLWIPNISSQIKHTLAFCAAISMDRSEYSGRCDIGTYIEFKEFAESLYELLPEFPMLEDYIPEPDWGEVWHESIGSRLKIFYGGAIERIPDFISAFLMTHAENPDALEDMHAVLQAQDVVLNAVSSEDAGSIDNIQTGHIELPTEAFWEPCSAALHSLAGMEFPRSIHPGLVCKLGGLSAPIEMTQFTNAVVTGMALPIVFIDLDERRYPISLRNAAGAVIGHWSDTETASATKKVADFLQNRQRKVMRGPLFVSTSHGKLPYTFAAVLTKGAKPYFIIVLNKHETEALSQLEEDLTKALKSDDWALTFESGKYAGQIRNQYGKTPAYEDIVVVAVLSEISTATEIVDVPRTQAHVLPFPDFLTIFDSVENLDELDRFWKFQNKHKHTISMMSSNADQFAAFRDSSSVLVDGAFSPNLIAIDPHWGSNWRYKELSEYWENAPPAFPSLPNTSWKVERGEDDVYILTGRGLSALSRTSVINMCTVHVLLVIDDETFDPKDGQVLDLFAQILADSLKQREPIISALPLFSHRTITMRCQVNNEHHVSSENPAALEQPLISNLAILNWEADKFLELTGDINLIRAQEKLRNVADSSFEVLSLVEWIKGVSRLLNISVPDGLVEELRKTGNNKPRFLLKYISRAVDVPEFADPQIPSDRHFKNARRELALTLSNLGVKQGHYELSKAKALIDPSRDTFRSQIHEIISSIERERLVQLCIEQIEALTVKYDREYRQLKISLEHEVTYDRKQRMAEIYKEFTVNTRNYRYLLECKLSLDKSGSSSIDAEQAMSLLASIDWLMTLYNASDVLHNGIDVAGLELDQFLVPSIIYSGDLQKTEIIFATESAGLKLGLEITPSDEVSAIDSASAEWVTLDNAFSKDTGIDLTKFLASLSIFYRWPSVNDTNQLRLSYSAPRDTIIDVLCDSVIEMTPQGADAVLRLVTLNPDGIRQLLGKKEAESDVPIWEHNKRGDRYIIKPVITETNGNLRWGAASVERASRVWQQSLTNGYMPADYAWPNVAKVVEKIKAKLDSELEQAAEAVLLRATSYVVSGIDFSRRFPKEGFPNVGDFDALAYWPDLNRWVIGECKNDKPVFCLKDARRLRDRMFGDNNQAYGGYFAKIERRRNFFLENTEQLRTILGWPSPNRPSGLILDQLYISREFYWWMQNPPYSVETEFVRIDRLDSWLRGAGLYLKKSE